MSTKSFETTSDFNLDTTTITSSSLESRLTTVSDEMTSPDRATDVTLQSQTTGTASVETTSDSGYTTLQITTDEVLSIPLPHIDAITSDSFRVVFSDPPPPAAPGDPEGRQIQFYFLIIRDGDTIVQQQTIRPFEGTSYTFSGLTEGTMYSLEINALVGATFDFLDLDLELQFISTLSGATATQTLTTGARTTEIHMAFTEDPMTTQIYTTVPIVTTEKLVSTEEPTEIFTTGSDVSTEETIVVTTAKSTPVPTTAETDFVTTGDPYDVTVEMIFTNVTGSSLRIVFLDKPPQITDSLGRQILFYVLVLKEGNEVVDTQTIGAFEGTFQDFTNLKPGTNYSVEVNFLVGLSDGSQTELVLPNIPPMFVNTKTLTDTLIADITFDSVTTNSFRAIFSDPPPNFDDSSGRLVLFYVLALHDNDEVIDTITISADGGAYHDFVDLKPGTNYSIQVNFLVGFSDGSQTELILSDRPHQHITTSDATDAPGCQGHQFTCMDGQCIEESYMCNTFMDCSDGSDEMGCPEVTCPPGHTLCDLDACILNEWICDGNPDCLDGTDEAGCPATCEPGQLICDEIYCILDQWLCDGVHDCEDGTDEAGCPTNQTSECSAAEFQCSSGNQCVAVDVTCDGYDDCNDASDEADCPAPTCPPGESPCDANVDVCLPVSWFCDGFTDCVNGTDESDERCTVSCTSTEYFCQSGDQCIPENNVCDGFDDCNDGSEELGCPASCPPDTILCDANSCILPAWICDDRADCADGTDEAGCPTTQALPPP